MHRSFGIASLSLTMTEVKGDFSDKTLSCDFPVLPLDILLEQQYIPIECLPEKKKSASNCCRAPLTC